MVKNVNILSFAPPLLFSLLLSAALPAIAQDLWSSPEQANTPWRKVNDAIFNILIEPNSMSRPEDIAVVSADLLWESMAMMGEVREGSETFPSSLAKGGASRIYESRSVSFGGTDFTVLMNDRDDLFVGLFMRFGQADHEIPGLRGSLSNCSELNEPDCEWLNYSHTGSLTFGLASCLCHGPALDLGDGMMGLPCYFGRGGTYMDYTLAYGPVAADILRSLVDDKVGEAMRKICMGSPIAHRYSDFLLHEGSDEVPGDPVLGVDTTMPLRYLAAQASDGENDFPKPLTILQHFSTRD